MAAKYTISKELKESLDDLVRKSLDDKELFYEIRDEVLSKALIFGEKGDYNKFLREIESIIDKKSINVSTEDKTIIRRSFIAFLLSELPLTIKNLSLSVNSINLYPIITERIIHYLKNNLKDSYDIENDYYRKDLKFAFGLSIPCGVVFVDLASSIKIKSIIRSLIRPGNLKSIFRYFKEWGIGSWFEIHLDTRYLDDFNESGWDECYLNIAELLKNYPSIRGMIGTSWFYDPKLLEISPQIAYLQKRPLERGAYSISHGAGLIDIERAISKSQTRRKLYEEGEYKPRCYSLLWPRNELLNWSESINKH